MRYEVTSKWTEVERDEFDPTNGGIWDSDRLPVLIITEIADIRDKKTGDTYRNGAYRVRSFQDGRSFKRAKTFYGETAWSDAERYAHDIWSEANFA